MKKVRNLLISLLTVMSVVSCISFAAGASTEFTVSNLNYSVNRSGTTVTLNGYSTEPASNTSLTIPATVTYNGTSYAVTAVADYAFKDVDTITSVKIGRNVQSIGFEAFYDCDGITAVTHNSNNALTTLGTGCFTGCDNLRTVTLPSSVTRIEGGSMCGTFWGCTKLTTINLSDLTGLTYIGERAFYNCTALTGIRLPDSLTYIDSYAFYNCDAITTVNIPNSLTAMEYGAFEYCDGLRTVTSGSSCVLTSIPAACFSYCENLRTVTLPASLTRIEGSTMEGTFYGCRNLTTVNFSDLRNLTYIGDRAFKDCTSLTGIRLPDSLTCIDIYAFCNCDSITTVNIPNSLTTMEYGAFEDCDGLQTITSGSSCVLTSLPADCFASCDSLRNVTLPRSLTSIDGGVTGTFHNCGALTSVNFSALTNLETIGDYSFYNCSSLRNIVLPSSVRTIGYKAFGGCTGLTTVKLPVSTAPSVGRNHTFEDNTTIYVPRGASGYEENNWELFNVVYGDPPTNTPAPTSAPTSTPRPTSAPSSSSSSGAAGFVERLYTLALGRSSDAEGQAAWTATITSGENTGADVARGFLYSPEFLNRNVTNEEFVRVLYRTFFDREGEAAGVNAWVNVLNSGESKEHVIEGFINSTEWANLCLRYGIASGGTGVPNIEIEPNQQTIAFCTRLYTTCLNRAADQNGLMAWARQLANQRDTGSGAARGFFFGTEFINQHVSNGEFVTRLYRTFMDRDPDEAGYNAWVQMLDEGSSRESVFEGFAQSPEFTRICADYGIRR